MPNSQDKNLFKLFFLIINIYFEYLLPIRLFIYTINSIFTKLITSFSSLLSPKILHLVFIDKVFVTTMVNSIFFTKLIISFPSLFIWIRFRVTFIPSHHNRQKLDEEWRRKERKKKKAVSIIEIGLRGHWWHCGGVYVLENISPFLSVILHNDQKMTRMDKSDTQL